ncbi:hypothetical protein FFWV33_14520 [Flavobacterium faecale]|uniref:Lipoprotein n=1 Tax=Flavobacterium faecale TaxID=1355330 RepID=A0A2S1LFX4_9FLAO|nr:hypothetical protein [Flavobacterium faecale]AWG22655.1 hypothetical protein FFWV33_14520 [Flavobacterium faecale]
MKNIFIALLLLLTISCKKEVQKETLDTTVDTTAVPKAVVKEQPKIKVENFKKSYLGTIGNGIEVVFTLSNTDGVITGSYFYKKVGVDIPLLGSIEGDEVILYELDSQKNKVATIASKLVGNKIVGTWKSMEGQEELKVVLTKTDKYVAELPENIAGTYTNASGTACSFKLIISMKENNYFYTITTAERTLKGKVSFNRDIDYKDVYINFNGIKWAAYNGAINEEGEPVNKNLKIPVGIDGLLNENEISIQNYGNAMNNYTKFRDCDDKYILLKK